MNADQFLKSILKPQKSTPPKALQHYVNHFAVSEGMVRAYLSNHYQLAAVGKGYGKVM